MDKVIFDNIKGIIARLCVLPTDYVLTPQIELEVIPEWSSIIYVMLLAEIESAYSVKLSGEDLFDVETIGDLADLVEKSIQ